jgi:hypothetical protein
MANRPSMKWRAGSIEGCIWRNERSLPSGDLVEFKTATLTRKWKDKNKDIWRSEVLNVRKGDVPKLLVILNKIHEELVITGKEGDNNG